MLKKISLTLVFALSLLLIGCTQESDTDIIFQIKSELEFDSLEVMDDITIPTSENDDVTLVWTSSRPEFLDIDGTVNRPEAGAGNTTVSLTVVITLNDALTTKNFEFTVLEEESVFDTRFTDGLTMDFSYENTDFVADGIGEVELVSCVDGDTAIFTEGSNTFSVRFLGINTPESTYKFEPWGKPASDFTCEKLENATTIVLEYDAATTRTDGNERYLAWVWYDGRLLNLELVEEAFTMASGAGGLKYESIFFQAEFKTRDTEERIFGDDLDETFDYSLDGVQITIEELVTNQELYVELKVVIRGVISRTLDGHPYIQQGDYGIYLYSGFELTEKLEVGNFVLISGLTVTYFPDSETGALQLTGFSKYNTLIIDYGIEVVPTVITIDELSRDSIGSLVQINELTVLSIYQNSYDDAFTITAEDSLGNVITIRRDTAADPNLTGELFTVGTIFSVIAPVGRYNGEIQLVLITLDDVTFITE